MKFVTVLVQLLIISVPVVLFGWLVNMQLVPSGSFFVAHNVHEDSAFIERLLPDQRVEPPVKDADGNWIQKLIGDPVFFFVHPHRWFDEIEFEILFKNDTLPILEFGALANTKPEIYSLQPLQNLLIDNLNWYKLSDGQITLLQRNQIYSSIKDFYANPPLRNSVAVYNIGLNDKYRINDYISSTNEQTIDVSLRGRHEFKTYIKDEVLNFEISYMDMNRSEGADAIHVLVLDENDTPVDEVRIQDDGDFTKNAKPSGIKKINLRTEGLSEGVYKVILDVSRDIFFREIKTTQQKIVFLNTIFFGDEVAYKEPPRSVYFWTGSKKTSFRTRHSEGIQDVMVGNQTLKIEEPYKQYTLHSKTSGLLSAKLNKGDVEMFVDGPVSFSKEQYFNPDPIRLRDYSDVNSLGVNYILAKYTEPEQIDDWLVSRVSFNTSDILFQEDKTQKKFTDGVWKFVFSTPSISEHKSEVFIKDINIMFKGRPFGIKEIFKYFSE